MPTRWMAALEEDHGDIERKPVRRRKTVKGDPVVVLQQVRAIWFGSNASGSSNLV